MWQPGQIWYQVRGTGVREEIERKNIERFRSRRGFPAYMRWARFLTRLGNVMFATEPPKMNAEYLRRLLTEVRTGDIICRKYSYYLDSVFIAGEYSHAGVVVDAAAGPRSMVHAIAEGVQYVDIIDFVMQTDGFLLLRPPAGLDLHKGIALMHKSVGLPYDFIFVGDPDAYYCFELAYAYLNESGLQDPPPKHVYAEDLAKHCTVIYEPLK